MKFDLKFEISDVKYLVKFGGKTGKHQKFRANYIGANFGKIFGNFVSNFTSFFGNLVQQKGGVDDLTLLKIRVFIFCKYNTRTSRGRHKKAAHLSEFVQRRKKR